MVCLQLASALLACRQDALQHAVELFDWEILTDVAVRSGPQGGVHVLFVVAHAGENNDWYGGINLTDESRQCDAVDLGHFQVDDDDFTVVMSEPGGCFEAIGEGFGGMTELFEISDEELGYAGIIVDDQELAGWTLREVHTVL